MRAAARLLVLLGAVGIGWFLLDASPRDVVLVYDVRAPGATELDVEIRSGGEVVRSASLRLRPGEQARHPVRLRDGTYRLGWRLHAPDGPLAGEREVVVDGEQTIVLPLGP